MKLDIRDKKLLFELDMGARQSLGSLAKKIGLSKRGVDYKMKNFVKKDVVLGYKAIIDSSKLGYYFFRILISFKVKDKIALGKFEKYMKSNESFAYVFRCQGEYDYACAIWSKSIIDFKELIDNIYFKFGKNVERIEEHIPTYVKHLQNRFLLNKVKTREIDVGGEVTCLKLDKIEKYILKVLGENARIPIYEIADNLNVTPKQVSYRIKKLEEAKIILGYRAVLNYKKLGYSYFKCMLNFQNINQTEFKQIKENLVSNPQLIFINHGIGFGTFDVSAVFLTVEEFYLFIEEIKLKFLGKLKNYEILLFGENVKYNYVPFL